MRLTVEGLERANAMTVPQDAIMQGSKGSYVYKLNDKNQVEMVSVTTGIATSDGSWIIDRGLNEGDKVVVDNLMKIRPGMTVNPIDVTAQNTNQK